MNLHAAVQPKRYDQLPAQTNFEMIFPTLFFCRAGRILSADRDKSETRPPPQKKRRAKVKKKCQRLT